jgi:SAM-dependent methyltransferase
MSEANDLAREVAAVSEPWKNSPYYADAEQWTHVFWREKGIFRRQFERLDLSNVVDLACGHGRHSEQIVTRAGNIIMVDVLAENIAACRKRLGQHSNVSFIQGDGYSFRPVPDASVTAIFCYDAMVHFSPNIVASYLQDAQRILKPGGRALFHHSNYDGPADRHYGQNPHARNIMTRERFTQLAEEAGMRMLHSEIMNWVDADLDCLTLVEKS